MKLSKQHLGRCAFLVELLVFSGYYCVGASGILSLMHTKKEISQINQEIQFLQSEIHQLQTTIAMQKKHPFFKEKIAREQLQMAHENEEIYIV